MLYSKYFKIYQHCCCDFFLEDNLQFFIGIVIPRTWYLRGVHGWCWAKMEIMVWKLSCGLKINSQGFFNVYLPKVWPLPENASTWIYFWIFASKPAKSAPCNRSISAYKISVKTKSHYNITCTSTAIVIFWLE